MSDNFGELIGKYIQLRDKRDAIKKKQKEELAPYNTAMLKLEDYFQKVMNKMDLENLKGDQGTVYKATQTSITVADWDAFLDYVKVMGAWHILEKRAAKTAIEEILEETGAIPPGLNMNRAIKINVRRS